MHDLGILRKQRGFFMPSGTPIKHGQQVNTLLTASPLPSTIAVVITEAHTKRTKPANQGKALADSQAIAAATESTQVAAAHVDEVHSASTKTGPSLPDFCHPDVLVT